MDAVVDVPPSTREDRSSPTLRRDNLHDFGGVIYMNDSPPAASEQDETLLRYGVTHGQAPKHGATMHKLELIRRPESRVEGIVVHDLFSDRSVQQRSVGR